MTLFSKACTPAEKALPPTVIHCLTSRQARGLLADALSGLVSFLCVTVVLIFITRNAFRAMRASADWRIMKMPIELYLLSLFVADFIHGFGASLNLKWVLDGKVRTGTYCSVQGFSLNVGSTIIAMTTLAIAVHTFIVVWRGITTRSFLFPSLIVGATWMYTVLYAAISMKVHNDPSNPFYQPTPYWCWVSNRLAFRIVGQWFWMWSALLLSLLLYLLLFLWIRGNVTVRPEDPWWKFRLHRRVRVYNHSRMQRYSYIMIVYAVIYSTLVLPWSIVRWMKFVLDDRHGGASPVPSDATFATISIYNLIGVANILLFFFTREGLLFFQENRTVCTPTSPVVVSNFSTIECDDGGKVKSTLEPGY